MRSVLYGVAALALLHQTPALADCAEEIAALEGELATSQESKAADDVKKESSDADEASDAEETPEETVDRMVQENSVVVETEGAETKLSGTGEGGPTENWFGDPPVGHEAAGYLINAKKLLGEEREQACMDEVNKAREALSEPAPDENQSG